MLDFQIPRMRKWLWDAFAPINPHILLDVEERALRFGEESLELIQSLGTTKEQAHALVEQVFNKPLGDPFQELGGVLVTLSSVLTVVPELDADQAFETEMSRVEKPAMMEKVRQKHRWKAVVSARSLDGRDRHF